MRKHPAPDQDPARQRFLQGRQVISAKSLINNTHGRQVLVLYLERPHAILRGWLVSKRALLIQRLEGSRPHGSLCALNGSDRVQRSEEDAEIGVFFRFEDGMEQW